MDIIYCSERLGGNSPFLCDDVILMDGIIKPNDNIKFINIIKNNNLENNKNVKIYINSPGGDLNEALEIAKTIKINKFSTFFSSEKYNLYSIQDGSDVNYGLYKYTFFNNEYISNICMSAANFIFIAGKERVIDISGFLPFSWGTHRIKLNNQQNFIDIDDIQDCIIEVIELLCDSEINLNFLHYFFKRKNVFSHLTYFELSRLNINNLNKYILELGDFKNTNIPIIMSKIKNTFGFKSEFYIHKSLKGYEISFNYICNKDRALSLLNDDELFIRINDQAYPAVIKMINENVIIYTRVNFNFFDEKQDFKFEISGLCNALIDLQFEMIIDEGSYPLFKKYLKTL